MRMFVLSLLLFAVPASAETIRFTATRYDVCDTCVNRLKPVEIAVRIETKKEGKECKLKVWFNKKPQPFFALELLDEEAFLIDKVYGVFVFDKVWLYNWEQPKCSQIRGAAITFLQESPE